MRITRSLLLLSLGLAGCAPPRPAPGAIAPAATRGSNAGLEADLAVMDAWEARRAVLVRDDALKGLGSPRASELANAGAWLAFARDAMVAHRRSTAADEAFAEARRIIENVESANTKNERTAATAPPAAATRLASAATPRSSAAASSYPALWARTRALDASPITRHLVAQVEVELARAAAGNERDSAAVHTELASTGTELPAGAVPMQRVARASVSGAPNASCPLAPHVARARQLLAEAESRQRQHLAALAADSAARAAAEARVVLLASIRDDGRVRTRPVHFALDKDELSAASRALLDKVSAALREHPGLVVVLEGHTDPRGSVEYNLDLSRRRARAVHRYLEGTGLDVSRIDVKGLGLAARRTTGTSREAYALDRRVMVRFSMEDGTPIAETEELLDVQVEEARREAARRAVGTGARSAMKPASRPAPKTSTKSPTKAVTRTTTSRSTGVQR
jgi:outer membrane protein OmpA-like peptidoglycan-associated protein